MIQMERDGDDGKDNTEAHAETSALSSTLLLDHVGQVILTFNSDGLTWELVNSVNHVTFFHFVCIIYQIHT